MIRGTQRRWFILGALLAVSCVPSVEPGSPTGSGGARGTGGATSAGTGGAVAASSGGTNGSGGSGQGTGGSTVTTSSGGATGSGGAATGGSGAGTATGGGPATGSGGATGGSGTGTGAASVGGASGRGGTTVAGTGGSTGAGGSVTTDPGTEGDGDFMAGPTYTKQTDLTSKGAPAGRSFSFTMNSADSKVYTGLDTTLNTPRAFTRNVNVYIPAKYKDGTAAPFIVIQDGPGALGNIRLALDNLTASTDPARRLPAFIAIALANGGGDSLGSQRGLEYDTMSDRYARFVDAEVLPAVLANAQIKAAFPALAFTADPDGRATIGCSSGGAAAMAMGWFRPDLFRRIVAYSGTFVDQQDTDAAEEKMYPFGAWEYHSGLSLIANTTAKPLRVFVNANETDNGYNAPESGHHNWLLANQRMAAAMKAKGYHYRYVYGQGAGHCDGKVQDATLADTLVWLWRGYPVN